MSRPEPAWFRVERKQLPLFRADGSHDFDKARNQFVFSLPVSFVYADYPDVTLIMLPEAEFDDLYIANVQVNRILHETFAQIIRYPAKPDIMSWKTYLGMWEAGKFNEDARPTDSFIRALDVDMYARYGSTRPPVLQRFERSEAITALRQLIIQAKWGLRSEPFERGVGIAPVQMAEIDISPTPGRLQFAFFDKGHPTQETQTYRPRRVDSALRHVASLHTALHGKLPEELKQVERQKEFANSLARDATGAAWEAHVLASFLTYRATPESDTVTLATCQCYTSEMPMHVHIASVANIMGWQPRSRDPHVPQLPASPVTLLMAFTMHVLLRACRVSFLTLENAGGLAGYKAYTTGALVAGYSSHRYDRSDEYPPIIGPALDPRSKDSEREICFYADLALLPNLERSPEPLPIHLAQKRTSSALHPLLWKYTKRTRRDPPGPRLHPSEEKIPVVEQKSEPMQLETTETPEIRHDYSRPTLPAIQPRRRRSQTTRRPVVQQTPIMFGEIYEGSDTEVDE